MSQDAANVRIPLTVVPSSATFTLVLDKLLKGAAPVIANASCLFTYEWNFATNRGLAKLVAIDNCAVDITLHPLGITGHLDFMSSMDEPYYTVINGQRVVLNRIILDISLATNERSGGIMFHEDGSVIEVTDNWGNGNGVASLI
jgi:hypothetical protein